MKSIILFQSIVNLNRNYHPKIHFLKIIFHLGIHFIFCALSTFYNYYRKLITDRIVKVDTAQKIIRFPQCKEIQIVITIYFQISSILSCFVIGIFLHWISTFTRIRLFQFNFTFKTRNTLFLT